MRRQLIAAVFAAALAGAPSAQASYRDVGFHSSDGNVGCWIERDYESGAARAAHCYTEENDWPSKRRDCGEISEFEEFRVRPASRRGLHHVRCIGGVPWNLDYTKYSSPMDAPALRKGQTKRIGSLRCTARSRSEIRCTNARRHGFTVSRTRRRVF